MDPCEILYSNVSIIVLLNNNPKYSIITEIIILITLLVIEAKKVAIPGIMLIIYVTYNDKPRFKLAFNIVILHSNACNNTC